MMATIHVRLMSESVAPLLAHVVATLNETQTYAEDRLGRDLQEALNRAYQAGVRDGYVQAVAEAGEEP